MFGALFFDLVSDSLGSLHIAIQEHISQFK